MHIRNNFSLSYLNIFIQVIFPNIITYLDKTFEEQNDILRVDQK